MTWPGDFFFNQDEFIKRRSSDNLISFPKNSRAPLIYFTHIGDEIISLHKSTFGGFIITDATTANELSLAVEQVFEWCKAHNTRTITVKIFPEIYNPPAAKLSGEILTSSGFSIHYRDVAQVLTVSGNQLSMNVHRRRRLRHCIDAGYVFEQLSTDRLPEAYALFTESRSQKGYPVTMTLDDFNESFKKFPDYYLLFGVMDSARIIAACVCIKVAPEILYVFFIGDSVRYRNKSPVTQLVAGVYSFAAANNISIVDLGISTDQGILNDGLYSFKKSFGATDSFKNTYKLKL